MLNKTQIRELLEHYSSGDLASFSEQLGVKEETVENWLQGGKVSPARLAKLESMYAIMDIDQNVPKKKSSKSPPTFSVDMDRYSGDKRVSDSEKLLSIEIKKIGGIMDEALGKMFAILSEETQTELVWQFYNTIVKAAMEVEKAKK